MLQVVPVLEPDPPLKDSSGGCPGEPNHADTGLGWRDSAAEERAWCPVGLVEFDLTPTGVQQLQVKSADALLWM